LRVRSLTSDDIEALCRLVDADRLPGQPACTADMVTWTLAGRSRLHRWWWQQLVAFRMLGADSEAGELLGAGAIGRRANGWRYLLWLHAGEDPSVVEAVLGSLLQGVGRREPVYAFWFSTELSVGLDGLPRQARRVTHDALLGAGFTGIDRWLYLRGDEPSPAPELPFRHRGRGGDSHIEMGPEDSPVGAAETSLPSPGLGVVWWLEVDAAHRRQGTGRQLLRAARSLLAEAGATETILFVDHDDPAERDRRPALSLYRSEGFSLVDHLWSYRRGDGPPDAGPQQL
jgi:ribosomal protein S18 acetylase RimI-like enzyme